MARAYSDDLRRKLLKAHRRGEGSLSQLAKRFDVSFGWARKISATLRSTGKMERPPSGPRGPSSKLTEAMRQELRNWIGRQADLTLAELQVRLYEQRDLEISVSRLWQVLKQMGLRLKKSHSTPPSKTRLRASGSAASGEKQRTGSIRRS
jgi:transposase